VVSGQAASAAQLKHILHKLALVRIST